MSETISVADAEQERLARIVAEMDAAMLADVQRILQAARGGKGTQEAAHADQPAMGSGQRS
jgi:hypothetical protein